MKMKSSWLGILLIVANWCFAQSNTVSSGIYVWKPSDTPSETVLSGSTTFLEPLQVSVETIKPGERRIPTKEMSTAEELLIVKEGKLTINGWEGNNKTVGPGSVVFLMPNKKFAFENQGGGPLVFFRLRYHAKSGVDVDRGKSNGGSFVLDRDKLPFKTTAVGGRRDYFNRPTATTSRFEMHVTTLNAGLPSHAPHKHAEEEIILLIKGNATMMVENKEYPMSAGDFVFAASNDFHGIRNTGKDQCEYFAFQWK